MDVFDGADSFLRDVWLRAEVVCFSPFLARPAGWTWSAPWSSVQASDSGLEVDDDVSFLPSHLDRPMYVAWLSRLSKSVPGDKSAWISNAGGILATVNTESKAVKKKGFFVANMQSPNTDASLASIFVDLMDIRIGELKARTCARGAAAVAFQAITALVVLSSALASFLSSSSLAQLAAGQADRLAKLAWAKAEFFSLRAIHSATVEVKDKGLCVYSMSVSQSYTPAMQYKRTYFYSRLLRTDRAGLYLRL